MPKFIVTQVETTHVQYLVEADDEDAAREIFFENEQDMVEIGEELQAAQVLHVRPTDDEALEQRVSP